MADWLLRERLRLCSMLDVMQFSPVYARSLATSLGVSMGCISWVYLCGVYPGYMYGVYIQGISMGLYPRYMYGVYILGISMGYISWVYLAFSCKVFSFVKRYLLLMFPRKNIFLLISYN